MKANFVVGDIVGYRHSYSRHTGDQGVVVDTSRTMALVEWNNTGLHWIFKENLYCFRESTFTAPAEYIKKVKSVDTNYPAVNERISDNQSMQALVHGSLGLAGETGEVVDMIKKHLIFNKPLDTDKLKKELGDVLWYMSVIIHEIGSSYEEIMQMNAEKLDARYPQGFSEQAALERKDLKNGRE